MKATGIVRRIDDLGRVVIPKEIRRTMRIREGDPLEIFTSNDGEVVFKKYSPMGELGTFAAQYADVMSRALGQAVVISDRDHIIAVSGTSKKEMQDRPVSPMLENAMEQRQSHIARAGESVRMTAVEGVERYVAAAVPILSAGDVIGSVCLLLPETGALPGEGDLKMVQVAAAFLGRQMEE
ncbi:MAG: AbrB/MazE/SpoVT family DNA-binding domain-containing protein [Clostridia bacterium]|nr:AbrB/MazE/SpoVT family DNA-binding domain-containing protein [Clostridia bacterium]